MASKMLANSDEYRNVCRTCLRENGPMKSVFGQAEPNGELTFSSIISVLTTAQVSKDDELPQQVCGMCIKHIKNSYDFMEQCNRSHQIFRMFLSQNSKKLSEIVAKPPAALLVSDWIKHSKDYSEQFTQTEDGVATKLNVKPESNSNDDSETLTDKYLNPLRECDKDPELNELLDSADQLNAKLEEELSAYHFSNECGGNSSDTENESNTDNENSLPVALAAVDVPVEALLQDPFDTLIKDDDDKTQIPFLGVLDDCNGQKEAGEAVGVLRRGRGRPRKTPIKSESPKPVVKSAEKRRRNECKQCGKCFSRGTHLRRHEITHAKDRPYNCLICKKGFTRLDHMNLHMAHHEEKKKYTCDICPHTSTRAENLRRHKAGVHGVKSDLDMRRRITNPKTQICSVCNKGFTTNKYLQMHMKIHTKREWKCKMCTHSFPTKSELLGHVNKSHAHERPFLCSECGLRFVRNDYLVVHMRRHNGEKPYKCQFCGKGFPRATDLTVHERYHTGEKSHLCPICGKGFQRAYNLLVHSRVHTGERPYRCAQCDKSFAQGNDLKAHIRRHTGERYRCEVCNEGFIQGYHLTQHKQAVHGIDMKSHIRRVEKFNPKKTEEILLELEVGIEEDNEYDEKNDKVDLHSSQAADDTIKLM